MTGYRARLVLIVLLALAPPVVARSATDAGLPGVPRERRPGNALAADAPGAPWRVVTLSWEDDEPPSDAAARIAAAAPGGGPLVVELRGGHPVHGRCCTGSPDAYRRAWALYLRAAARAAGDRAFWFVLDRFLPAGGAAAGESGAALAAYEIKSAAVLLRSEVPGAGVALRVDLGGLELLRRALAGAPDLTAYVDGVLFAGGAAGGPPERALGEALDANAPGISRWVEVEDGGSADEAAARAVAALAARADLVLVRRTALAPERLGTMLSALARTLAPGLGLPAPATAGIEIAPGSPEGTRFASFFDETTFREVVAVWSTTEPPAGAEAGLLVESALRRDFQVVDPVGGTPAAYARQGEGEGGRARLDLPATRRPLFLTIARLRSGGAAEVGEQSAEVTGTRGVNAEEIIAAHQGRKAFQDDRLHSVRRPGEITFRTRFGQLSGTFDLTIRADYFWERGTGAEWVIGETLFNGVRLSWDRIPEVPFISRERVVAVPLELALDRRYRYELEASEEVEGRRCWRLRFTPADAAVSLYRGRAWIDQATLALVRVTTLQTNLEPPLISDEQTQTFRPFEGPDGTVYWLLDALEGQQIYTVGGSNLVVLRVISFGVPTINDAGFTAAQTAARSSDRQMLRDTPDGFKWLEKTGDGTRRVRERGDPTQVFALAGLYKDQGTTGVVPLAGVNYTNIDFLGGPGRRGGILNVFFAGPLVNVALAKPGLFGTRLDAGLVVNAVGFGREDKVYRLGEEIEPRRVERVDQVARASLGFPVGSFVKLRGQLELNYTNFRTAKTTRDLALPADHFDRQVTAEVSYDRRGWGVFGRSSVASRSRWSVWGPADAPVSADEVARTRSYRWYTVGAQKSFLLPYFQKVEVEARYQAGRDLDRFSAFGFGALGGTRVRGFGGAGIRFSRGALASASYGFNIADVLRFDVTVDHARVFDPGIAPRTTAHTGIGVGANFIGPWRTIFRLDAGYALRSDLRAAEGDKEFLVVVLRLF